MDNVRGGPFRTRYFGPTFEAVFHLFAVLGGRPQMPSWAEVLGHGAIRGQKALGMTRRCKSLHAILTLPRGAMRDFAAVIEITTLPVFHPGQELALGGTVALQLIRNKHARDIPQALEQLTKELLGGLLVAATLHQDVEHVVVLIHGTPQVMALPVDRQKDLVNGLVTNDKFCMSRQSQMTLHWSRKPYRSRPPKSAYAPAEMSQQGGYHETPLADTASVAGDSRRHASVGPSLSTSPAMEPAAPADRHSQPVSFFALTSGGDV